MAMIVVCGYMVRHPVPGNIYAYAHHVAGLARLGHEVVYVEESGWDESCYDPHRRLYGDDPSAGLALVAAQLARHRIDVPVVFVNRATGRTWGSPRRDFVELLARCDLVLNVGGVCWLPEFGRARRRALVDMDPMFTQAGVFARDGLDHYDTLFTYGTKVGADDCLVPTLGREWIPTVPPVVTSMWRLPAPPARAPFTTVTNWSAYGPVEYQGMWLGHKDVEFPKLGELPRRTGHPMMLAAASANTDDPGMAALAAGGWSLVPAWDVAWDSVSYRRFIGSSLGELSAAKHGYVASRCGWFSDRSVCYLAAGRPVVVQDTGFDAGLGEGEGILTFSTPDGAAEAVEHVVKDWRRHSAGARRVARRVFAHDVVLPRLLDAVGIRPVAV